MAETKETRLQKLREFAADPAAQATYAIGLLLPRYGLEVVRAALRVLLRHPSAAAQAPLRRLFAHYAEHGVQRDPGTYVRSEIVRVLRAGCAVAGQEEADLLVAEQGLLTYEFPPPAFMEEAAMLRSGALALLADLDDERACYHAARLLMDVHTDPMSGEPALTAVEVLAAQGEQLPLYAYVAQPVMRGEVAAACLRGLGALPAGAVPPLLAQLAECDQPGVLVGLVDLLLAQARLEVCRAKLAHMLDTVEDGDVYRYLAAALLASGDADLRSMALGAAATVMHPAQIAALGDALAGAGTAEDVVAAQARLAARGGARPARRRRL